MAGAAQRIEPANHGQSVPLQVGAWACLAGQLPGLGRVRSNQSMHLSHAGVSLPLPPSLPISLNKNLFLKVKRQATEWEEIFEHHI